MSATRRKTAFWGKGQRWRVRWRDETGEQVRLRAKAFTRKSDATEFAAKLDNDIRASVYRDPDLGKATFGEVAAEWFAAHMRIRDATAPRYERELRMYMIPKFGQRPINTITPADLAARVSELLQGIAPARYRVRGSNPPVNLPVAPMRSRLSPASIEHMVTVLGAIFKWAILTDRIVKNPTLALSIPRPVPADHVYLTHTQVRDLAEAAQAVTADRQDALLVYTLAYTGIRINEALAVKTAKLDTAAQRIRVVQTWTKTRDGKRQLGPPKSFERRTVPPPVFLAAELATLAKDRKPGDFLFQAKRGGPVHDHNWRPQVWNKAVTEAGLDGLDLTPHKLHHARAQKAREDASEHSQPIAYLVAQRIASRAVSLSAEA
ncbi:MAG: site-specific integrase [Bifidobacteriaceae bacterium]|jgi:integrase|nr:site-specific integrase [Bifidobacteriaceae bacterium]